MTPKEKAIDLVGRCYDYVNVFDDEGNANYQQAENNAKECALIAVDELIQFGNESGIREPMMYWNKVKQEIENL